MYGHPTGRRYNGIGGRKAKRIASLINSLSFVDIDLRGKGILEILIRFEPLI